MALIPAFRSVNSEKTLRRLVTRGAPLLRIPAFQAMVPVVDPDIWWHLRTGQWIIDPRSDAGDRSVFRLRGWETLGCL